MGHVQDLWFKTAADPGTGRPERVKTHLHGKGQRYRVRYIDPDGRERSRSFPDRQKRQAEDFLGEIESDKRRGSYLDPRAGEVTLQSYAEPWLASQTFDESTREAAGRGLRRHVYPRIGNRPLASITPTHIRCWTRDLQQLGLSAGYRQTIFIYLQAILDAAIDDEKIRKNPCRANSVRKPQVPARKIKPWSAERVHAVYEELCERYKITLVLGAGLGLRQGEAFGLDVEDIDFLGHTVHIVRQVKIIGERLCFGPPKGGKTRDVPLPESVALALAQHIRKYPPTAVTLPWRTSSGQPTTARLVSTSPDRTAITRQVFNYSEWRPALRKAGVTPTAREDGFHALRHFYASTLLDAGESIIALAEYLGHTDPGFTLRTYTHLMPSSQERTRRAIDGVFGRRSSASDGTQTA
jgi:integrase